MKYYKVTDENNGSCVLGELNFHYTLYEVGKWIKPKIGMSFVFKGIRAARIFARKSYMISGHIIWKCKVRNPVKIYRISDTPIKIDIFWKIYRDNIGSKPVRRDREMCAPLGTYGVSEVKLIKKVK